MTERVIELIAEYGFETVCIAFAINLLTAVIKLPVKKIAAKRENGANITRFIVFLPVVLGLALTLLYGKFIAENFTFGKEFVTLWLTSSSLSLTFYAVFEKLTPPKNKKENEKNNDERESAKETISADTEKLAQSAQKIILMGKKDDKTE